MFIVKLQGGLGNQMFQYAMARALSAETGEDFKLDIGYYEGQDLRKYELSHFKIREELASPGQVFWAKFLKKSGIAPGRYLEGYWQSEKYFKKAEEIIRREFQLKAPLAGQAKKLSEEIWASNSVSLHIRRGDYVTNKKAEATLGALPLEYYQEAIRLIKDRVSNPHFFIFSDDMDWVRNNVSIDASKNYVSGDLKNYEELELMSLCKDNIIANSSFSWWGAWLNNNLGKTVIAPKRWFADEARNEKAKDLIPDTWIRV